MRYYEVGSLRKANWFQRAACMSDQYSPRLRQRSFPVREVGLVGIVRFSRPSSRKTAQMLHQHKEASRIPLKAKDEVRTGFRGGVGLRW